MHSFPFIPFHLTVQFLLHVMGTEQRQTFNHIVDLRQRAMALELGT